MNFTRRNWTGKEKVIKNLYQFVGYQDDIGNDNLDDFQDDIQMLGEFVLT